ncbi:hypothetical protein [Roseisolibacter agri]|uniref:Bacterial surface antigen (D15) domain-containing protein n=1 Tax=Roseisolibacter agri TaxID=2014610 RepID=A0AA37QEI1_9BACT|nr:hypothetical protein [Roseisolibacter agri]GLC24840.1 hypothetical protein rosag_13530 [Roseisolibacter agri]
MSAWNPPVVCAASLALLMFAARGAGAQPDSAGAVNAACDGRRIGAIDVTTQPPTLVTRTRSPLGRAVLHALFQSAATREDVVRAFLVARPGDACDDALLRESARVLRTQGFLANVRVTATPDSGSTARLAVETVDEIPLVIGGGWRGGPSALTLGNANVLGYGLSIVGGWRDGDQYRDGVLLRLRKHALFGRPLILDLLAARDPLGDRFATSLARPFFTDLQRVGWHVGLEDGTAYRGFARRDAPTAALALDRRTLVAGGVARIGGRGLGAFAGPLLTYDRSRPAAEGVALTDSGVAPLDDDALRDRYPSYTAARVGAAFGVRLLNFTTARGFDALLAEQDVARGVQAAIVAARGVRAFGGDDADHALSTDVYAGAGTARSFVGLRLIGEGRRASDRARWEDVVASGRAAWYLKASASRTLVTSAELSGAWRERLPVQLALGDRNAGVRGYRGTWLAGGRRAVVRVESRRAVGGIGRYAHWGVATFADAGRTWSGDVPYGVTTVARASAGAGLLLAVPPRSRRLLRVDLAVPVTPDAPRRYRLLFTTTSAARAFWRDPDDVTRARAINLPATILGWP